MVGARHLDPAEFPCDLRDALVVRRDDDLAQRLGELATLNDALDERLASDEMQRLAGKARGREARRDDAENVHGGSLGERRRDCTPESGNHLPTPSMNGLPLWNSVSRARSTAASAALVPATASARSACWAAG